MRTINFIDILRETNGSNGTLKFIKKITKDKTLSIETNTNNSGKYKYANQLLLSLILIPVY